MSMDVFRGNIVPYDIEYMIKNTAAIVWAQMLQKISCIFEK